MRSLYFFWYHLNWLEFVTYVVIPAVMICMILVYIYFNLSLFRKSSKISFDYKVEIMDKLYDLEISINKNENNSKDKWNLELNTNDVSIVENK